MDNDLNNFFLSVDVFKGNDKVKTFTVPKSLVHDIFQAYAYPGSPFHVTVHDKLENFVLSSKILGL